MTKTNAMRLLDAAGITYRTTEYEYDEQGNILKEGDLDESFNEYIYGYIYTPDKAE